MSRRYTDIAKGETASCKDYQEILNLPTTSRIKPNKTSKSIHGIKRVESPLIKFDQKILFRAALADDVKTVSSMNFTGNDINTCDTFGWSGLMIAACEGSLKVCKFLLNQQCDITISDRSGNTAMSLAEAKNRIEIVDMLQEKMGNVRSKTDKSIDETTVKIIKFEPFWCEECKHMFKETTKESHSTSTLHRFNRKNAYQFSRRYFIPESNVGFKMMLRSGWNRESGLGPNNEGKLYPVKTTIRKARSGLGVKQDSARVTHYAAFDRDAVKWRPPAPKAKTKKQLERDSKKDRRKEIALQRKENRALEIMMDDATKTVNLLIETERLADQIIQNKQEIVALDKRRQDTREAIRELGKSGEKKAWITVGSMLVEMKKDKALELLQSDQNVIHQEINKLRSDQKVLVGQHRDLEFSDPLKGFDLNPMSRDEIGVLRTNLPGF